MKTRAARRSTAYLLAGLLCMLALPSTPALGAGKAAKKTEVRKVSLLYALNAGSGTLRPAGAKGKYELTLKGLDRDVTWFSDRPARRSGSFPARVLAESWKGFGFAADPPNAALVYSDKRGDVGRTVIVELSHPHLAGGKLSFAARVLDPGSVNAPDLADHVGAADRDPADAFTDASIFIDDTSAKVVVDCILQPGTTCEDVDVGPLNLYRESLQDANFSGSDLDGSRFEFSNLEETVLVKTSLQNSEFFETSIADADLDEADLTNAKFGFGDLLAGAHLEGADLTGADLKGTDMEETWLGRANFTGANLEYVRAMAGQWPGVDFKDANLKQAHLEFVADLWGASFQGADLEGASLEDDYLLDVDFEDANLTGAELTGVHVETTNFCDAKMPDGSVGPCDGPVDHLP